MTWRPSPQPPCPCENCNQPPPKATSERKCTPGDPCRFCGPVQFWDRDPAPVEEPPEVAPLVRFTARPPDPAEAFHRDLIRKRPFLGPAMAETARKLQQAERAGIIRRIFNATRRNT